MATLKNHPSFWLRDDAAASLARIEADKGIISINSAGRTVADQQQLLNRWARGGKLNRPPYLYQPQAPASRSNHVQNGSVAIDTSHINHMLTYGREYGWTRPFAGDPVHFEYHPELDKHKNRPAPTPAGSTLTPLPPTVNEDDMPDRGEVLNFRETVDGGKTLTGSLFFRSPTRGIIGIRNPYELSLLQRMCATTSTSKTEIMFPAETAMVNYYLVAPSQQSTVVDTAFLENTVKTALAALGKELKVTTELNNEDIATISQAVNEEFAKRLAAK
jgi:hypothetical protein